MSKLTTNFGIKIEGKNGDSNAKDILKWFAANGYDTHRCGGNVESNCNNAYFTTQHKKFHYDWGQNIPNYIKIYTLKEVLDMEFVLPEKWYFKGCSESVDMDESTPQWKWFNNKSGKNYAFAPRYYYKSDGLYSEDIPTGYEEITFEQFKQHVLKQNIMDKEIIGYNLKKECESYRSAAEKIADGFVTKPFSNGVLFGVNSITAHSLKNAGVLDLWFEPVYAQDEFKVGDWVYIKHSGKHIDGVYDINTNNPVRILKYKENITTYDHRLAGAYDSYCLFEDVIGNKALFNAETEVNYIVRKATEEEIKSYLVDTAVSKGFNHGVKFQGVRNITPTDLYGKNFTTNNTYLAEEAKCSNVADFCYNPKTDTLTTYGFGVFVVYEGGVWATIIPQEKVISVGGKFDVKIKDGKIWHGASNITSFVKDMMIYFNKIEFNLGGYTATIADIQFDKTGCQNGTTLKDWVKVWDTYSKLNNG